jgi:hypothetical protein
MSTARKLVSLAIIAIALGLLYPGVTEPVLTLSGTIEKSRLAELGIDMLAGEDADNRTRQLLSTISVFMGFDQIEGQMLAYQSTRSIWSTATELADTGNRLVAVLIILFSVVIPTLKLGLQLVAVLLSSTDIHRQLLWVNGVLSKWSMTDVFVMALLVAYMAGSASGKMGDMLTMNARLENGFYYFLAYCLFSIAASAAMRDTGPNGIGAGFSGDAPARRTAAP